MAPALFEAVIVAVHDASVQAKLQVARFAGTLTSYRLVLLPLRNAGITPEWSLALMVASVDRKCLGAKSGAVG
jgi:hypothetical protein